jgi:CRP-like cAMP-binding protein
MTRDARRYDDVTQRAIYLRSIPVAAELPPQLIHLIASHFREQSFEVGAALLKQGESVGAIQLLLEGSLSLTLGGREIGRLAPPQSAGFLNIIARTDAPYDAVALSALRTLELDAETLLELLEEHPRFLLATLRYASERLLYEMQELPAEFLSFPYQEAPFEVSERPIDLVERILFLRSLSVFKKTNLNALAIVSHEIRELRFAPESELWSAGDAADHGLMIVSGEIACSAPDGRTWRYGPGTVAGGVEGLAAKPRWFGARAVTPVVAFRGDTHELLDVFEDNFGVAMDFISMLASGLQALLARKAAAGQSTIGTQRNVSKLGAVPVGA